MKAAQDEAAAAVKTAEDKAAELQVALNEAKAGAEKAAQDAAQAAEEAAQAAEQKLNDALAAASKTAEAEAAQAAAALKAAQDEAAAAVKAAEDKAAALQTALEEAKADAETAAQAAGEQASAAMKEAEAKAAEAVKAAQNEAAAAVKAAEDAAKAAEEKAAEAVKTAQDEAAASVKAAEEKAAELAAQIEALNGADDSEEIEALQAQLAETAADRDYWKGQVKSLATDLNNLMTQDRFPRFDSEDMAISLSMPEHARLIGFNGLLHMISADGQAQAQLSVWVDGDEKPYAPGDVDIRQLWLTVEESLGEEIAPAEDTDDPAGCRAVAVQDGEETALWLFEGRSLIYLLEARGEAASVETLVGDIMAGIEFK